MVLARERQVLEPLISKCIDGTAVLVADPAYALIYVESL
jgi:hypothetical protein